MSDRHENPTQSNKPADGTQKAERTRRKKGRIPAAAEPLPGIGMSAAERRAAARRAAAEQIRTVEDAPREETLGWKEDTDPPQKRAKQSPATAHNEESKPPREDRSAPAPAVSGKERAVKAANEKFANLTVEDLMQDIFGKTSAPEPELPEIEDEPEDASEVFDERPETAPVPPETGEEAVGMESAPTVTRGKDGQMAFALPSIGKFSGDETDGAKRLFSAFSAPAPAAPPTPVKTSETVPESPDLSCLSEEEFQLLLDMDYEDELGHAIGFEKIQKHHELGVNGQEFVRTRRRRKTTERREYETQGQDTTFRKYYASRKREYVVRFVLSIVLLVIIFLYEQSYIAAKLPGAFNAVSYPVSYILFGLQFLALDIALYARRLADGFVRLVRFSPTDYSLCSVTVLVTISYHVYLLFAAHAAAPVLYLSPAAGMIALLALSDLLNWHRESAAFQVVSSRRQKYALIARVSVGGQAQNARTRLQSSEKDETLLFAHPVGFVRNYFANTEKRAEHTRYLGASLLTVLSLSVALGILLRAAGATFSAMLRGMIVAFLVCVPAASLLVTSVPMFLAAALRLRGKGAIIGERPVYESTAHTALVLPEADVFRPMGHERFELEESCDITRTMILTRALLDALGSPLADTVLVDAGKRIPAEEVVFTAIEADGVSALVGREQTSLHMGSVAYCQSRGVAIQPRTEEEYGNLQQRLLLVVVENKLCALFLADYKLSADMEQMLGELTREDVQLLVRTGDPGVHDDLFRRLQPETQIPVRVMKPSVGETDIRTTRVDATVVALGSCREAINTFLTARRVRRAARIGALWQALSAGVGMVIAALLAVFGRIHDVPAYAVTLYLFFWCLAHGFTSYLCLRKPNDKE